MKLKLPFDQGEIDLQLPYFFKIEDADEEIESEGDIYGCITNCKVMILRRTVNRAEIENRLYLAPNLPNMLPLLAFNEVQVPVTVEKWESEIKAAVKLLKTDFTHG